MYFIKQPEQLIGKKISYINLRKWDDYMIIITEDKDIFVFNKDYDGDIEIENPLNAKQEILKDEEIRNDLIENEIITLKDIKEYEIKQEEERKRMELERDKQRKEYRYKQYLKLKEEFKDKN